MTYMLLTLSSHLTVHNIQVDRLVLDPDPRLSQIFNAATLPFHRSPGPTRSDIFIEMTNAEKLRLVNAITAVFDLLQRCTPENTEDTDCEASIPPLIHLALHTLDHMFCTQQLRGLANFGNHTEQYRALRSAAVAADATMTRSIVCFFNSITHDSCSLGLRF